MKMECDQCHAQVSAEGIGNHGWIMINQVAVIVEMGYQPLSGSFCTVSCSIEWLQKHQPVTDT